LKRHLGQRGDIRFFLQASRSLVLAHEADGFQSDTQMFDLLAGDGGVGRGIHGRDSLLGGKTRFLRADLAFILKRARSLKIFRRNVPRLQGCGGWAEVFGQDERDVRDRADEQDQDGLKRADARGRLPMSRGNRPHIR